MCIYILISIYCNNLKEIKYKKEKKRIIKNRVMRATVAARDHSAAIII